MAIKIPKLTPVTSDGVRSMFGKPIIDFKGFGDQTNPDRRKHYREALSCPKHKAWFLEQRKT